MGPKNLYPVTKIEAVGQRAPVFCWPQIRGGPSIVSAFLYVIRKNFLHDIDL